MEAFSLLKYWRSGGLVVTSTPLTSPNVTSAAAVAENNDERNHETDDDDGPFFDLEFSAHEASGSDDSSSSGDVEVEQDGEDEEEDGEEGEFNFTGSSNDERTDPNLTISPTDDLFFKGKLVAVEPDVFNSAEPNSKALFSGSLLKSATKFRVFMSALKKSKSNTITNGPEKTETNNGSQQTPQQEQHEEVDEDNKKQENNKQGKFFTVKLKVEEVPIVSLFTRDNSSRISTNSQNNQKSQVTEEAAAFAEEKRFSKEVVQKYWKMVKPLYVGVSKRKTTRLSGQLRVPAEGEVVTEAAAERNIPAGLRVVYQHLGKSRSASLAPGTVPTQRRDDSLLQQQDGIQSAILHCKRSFHASRDSDYTPLSRSESDSSNENATRKPGGLIQRL